MKNLQKEVRDLQKEVVELKKKEEAFNERCSHATTDVIGCDRIPGGGGYYRDKLICESCGEIFYGLPK